MDTEETKEALALMTVITSIVCEEQKAFPSLLPQCVPVVYWFLKTGKSLLSRLAGAESV